MRADDCIYNNDGTISSTSNWVSGKLEGERVVYFKNGKINQIHHFCQGKRCGVSQLFSESGVLLDERFFDGFENEIDYRLYKSDGVRDTDPATEHPVVTSRFDTITVGEYYEATIRLGNRRNDRIEVLISDYSNFESLDKTPLPMIDSITVYLKLRLEKPGMNIIEGAILESDPKHPDSTFVFPFGRKVFVRTSIRRS